MPKPTVRRLEVSEHNAWDKFVENSPQGTLFHKSYWLRALDKEFRIYGYFKGEELFAGLPLVCGVSRLGFKYSSHPLLTPYLGVIFKESEAKYVTRISNEKGMSRAIAARMKEDFDSIHFNFTPSSTDLQPFIWEGFSSNVRYTYLLNLDDLERVWKGMDESRRNDIRRAENDGIIVEYSDNFKEAFALVERTFQRQNRQIEFRTAASGYNEILSKRGQCKSFLAINKERKAIAVVYIVWDKKRSYYLLGGYDSERRHHGASAIAMWEAIKFTKEKLGLNEFDFEGSMIQPVEQFFRKFGGKLTPYYSVTWAKPSVRIALYTRKIIRKILSKSKVKQL